MKNNNKGFTMVEVLAAVVIIGLLAAVAIVSVSTILDKAEKNHYETQEKNMIMAAQSYAQDNRNILPKEIGSSKIIMLSELQNRKYIGDVLDRSKLSCSNESLDAGGSYVEIFRYSKDGYSYRPYLKCNKYETGKTEYGGEGPEITLTMTKNYDNPSFSFEIKDTEGKILSYSYVIYKYDILVRDSGSVPVSRVGSLPKKEVSLKDLIPGKFKIVFTATNMYGKKSVETIEGNILDENGPTCTNIQPVYGDWQKAPEVTITANCVDNSGSGCAKEIYSQIFREDIKIGFIEMTDNSGNKGNCEVGIYIDNTPPTKPIVNNPYENTWINKSYSIELKATDVTSGVEYFEYRYPDSVIPEEREWTIYEDSRRGESVEPGEFVFNTPKFSQERGEYVEIRACDQIGNCSETTKSMIKIDKTYPNCSISRNIASPNGLNNWYISDVTMSMNITDIKGSAATAVKSPISYELTTNTTASYTGMNMEATQGSTTAAGVVYKGYIKDEAGNIRECADANMKIDTVPPTSLAINNPNANSSGTIKWTKTDYNVTASSKDLNSGINYLEYSSDNTNWTRFDNSSANPNVVKTVTSSTFTTEGSYPYYVRACDKAGNCSASTSTEIKLDKTAPSCSTTKSNLNTTDGVTVSISCSENNTSIPTSGVSTCAGTSATSATKTGVKAAKTYNAVDVAGNSSSCSVSVSSKTQYRKRSCSENRCSAAGCQSGTAYYTRCYVSFIKCYTAASADGTCSTGTYNASSNRCEKTYYNTSTCPVGTKYTTAHALSDGSESYTGSCTAGTKPTTCGSPPLTTPGKYIYSCSCTTYKSDSSKCACSSWGSWTGWSDSSSNHCTDSWTCDGSTRTVYY